MPLLSKRIFNCVKPLSNVNSNEKVFTIPHTSEQFRSQDEYEKRVQLYKKRIWTCQSTGHVNLTHEEAWNSEKTVLKTLKEQFPPCYDKPVLELVHHSTKSLDCLVDQAWLMLQQTLVIGEKVLLKVKSGSKSMKAIVVKIDKAGIDANPTSNCSSPSSDKENAEKDENITKKWVPPKLLPYKYSIRFENEDSVIHSVPAGDLSRGDKPPSKELLRLFIRTYAVRAGQTPNSPWIVDDIQVKKLDLPNKFANFLLSPVKWRCDEVAKKIDEEAKAGRSPSKGSPRIKTKMDAKEEKRKEKAKRSIIKLKEKGERAKAKESAKKVDIVVLGDSDDSGDEGKGSGSDSDTPLSVVKNQMSPKKKSGDKVKKSKAKNPMSLADLKKKLEKKKQKKDKGKTDGKKEGKKKKKGQDPKQLTLLDLGKKDKKAKGTKTPEKKSPLKQKTPQKTPDGKKKLFSPAKQPPIVLKLQSAMKKEDKTLIRFFSTQAAKVLNSAQRGRLPGDVKDMIITKYEALMEKQKLSRMSEAEKKAYLEKQAEIRKEMKKKNKNEMRAKMRQKLKEQRKRHEDTELDLKDLPAPQLVETPENIPNEALGDIIMITEFISNYAGLLMPESENPIYTEILTKALSAGKDGFTDLCRVVTVLLQTLLQDQIAEDYQDLEVALADIPVNPCTCSELVRLCLRRHDSTDDKSDYSEELEDVQDEVPEDVIQLLENQELYQLSTEHKILILKGLCLRVMGTYSVQDYMEEKQQEFSKLWKTKLGMQSKGNSKKDGQQKDIKKEEKTESKDVKEEDNKPTEESNILLSHFYGKKGSDNGDSSSVKSEDKDTPTPMEDDPTDMITAVKRRRVTSAQAQEERRRKEQEDRIRREKEAEILRIQKEKEAFERQFKEASILSRLSLRQTPIGTDRHHSRYWIFSDITPGLYVEKGWVQDEINYSCCPDRDVEVVSDSSGDEEDDEETTKKSKNIVIKKCVDKTFPKEGQNLWFLYDDIEHVDKLLEALHPKGARESVLRKALEKQQTDIKSALAKHKKATVELSAGDGDLEMIESLRKELLETETRLRNGGLGGVEDFEAWHTRLDTAMDPSTLGDCLLETQEYVLEKFRDSIMSVKKKQVKTEEDEEEGPVVPEMAAGIIYWREAVKNASTYSRLHVLLGILDSCIKWEKSAENAKCKICRKKGMEDKLLLCDLCNEAFHMFCLRPALLDVPMGDWHCPACTPQRKRTREIRGRYTEEALSDSENEEEESNKRKKTRGSTRAAQPKEQDDVCFECKGDEDLVGCAECPSSYHLECHDPPLRHHPRGRWVCNDCKNGVSRRKRKRDMGRNANKRKRYVEQDSEDEEAKAPPGKKQKRGRPAAKPADSDEDNSSEEWCPEVKSKSRRGRPSGRARNSGAYKEDSDSEIENSKSKKNRTSRSRVKKAEVSDEESETEQSEEEVEQVKKESKKPKQDRKSKSPKSSGRSKRSRSDIADEIIYDTKPKVSRRAPSELSMMEDIVNEMLEFKDAWPFYNNVSKKDVPDYYDIIKQPISFQKIKDRLNCLVYGSPQEVIDAVALLFRNGIEYNKIGSEVYECLEVSEKHFIDLLSQKLPQYVYNRDVLANGYGDHISTEDGRKGRKSK